MDEMIAEAESKAQQIIDDAIARRRQLNLAISSLLDRRDEIAAEAARLAEELLAAVEELRSPARGGEPVERGARRSIETCSRQSPSQRRKRSSSPRSGRGARSNRARVGRGGDLSSPSPRRSPTLLVDPDAEDETPPHGNAR